MQNKAILSASPHIFSKITTEKMMREVIFALLPACGYAIYLFRIKAVIVLLSCTLSCIFFEYLYQRIMKKKVAIRDKSALLTGILLALILPPASPIWLCIIGSLVSIVLCKQIFGGLGYNIFNPALLGRAFLAASFPAILTSWTNPITLDAVTKATPLGLAKFEHIYTNTWQLFFGNVSGSLGETSALALIIGGVYLLLKKIIDYRVTFSYIITVCFIAFITHLAAPKMYAPALFHLLSGGLIIGAFFMATDPVTSPITKKGRWVFGIGCGIVTMVIRLWGGLPEGVMYSILLMNALTPLINRFTKPKRYGI